MQTTTPELPASERESFTSDVAGIGAFFIDPQSAAKRVFAKWFWLGPLLIYSAISILASYLLMPAIQHVMEVMPIPAGTNPSAFERGMQMAILFQRIGIFFSPVIAAVLYAIQAVIVLAASSVLAVKAKFLALYNLVAGCSLIQVLAALATVIVIKAKGEISTTAELRPALGVDIFLPEGANKFLAAFLGYFTVFEIWWLVMLVLIFSAAFRVSKGKALIAVSPLILFGIIFRVGAAALQRG